MSEKHEANKQLYNSVGQFVLSIPPTPIPSKGGEVEIDMSHLTKGMYYLKVRNQTMKVIIE